MQALRRVCLAFELFLALPAVAQDNVDPKRRAEAVIGIIRAPCGGVVETKRLPEGPIVARCGNGVIYGVVEVKEGFALIKYNAATKDWEPYK